MQLILHRIRPQRSMLVEDVADQGSPAPHMRYQLLHQRPFARDGLYVNLQMHYCIHRYHHGSGQTHHYEKTI